MNFPELGDPQFCSETPYTPLNATEPRKEPLGGTTHLLPALSVKGICMSSNSETLRPGHPASATGCLAQNQLTALLVDHWTTCYRWLQERHELELESCEPEVRQYCPIHGGDSGEAFHLYPDARVNGGCVCNSCGSFGDGIRFLTRYFESQQGLASGKALQRAERLLTGYVQDVLNLEELPSKVAKRVATWSKAHDKELVSRYLSRRGLQEVGTGIPAIISLRGGRIAAIDQADETREFPAVMSLVRDRTGLPISFHRTLVTEAGEKAQNGKLIKSIASVDKAVSFSGSYTDLDSDPSSTVLLIGEGWESVLAARFVFERLLGHGVRARAMLGRGGWGYGKMEVPPGIEKVYLVADRDHTLRDTRKSAAALAARHAPDGVHILIAPAPEVPGKEKPDWNDAWVELRPDACVEQARAAEAVTPPEHGHGSVATRPNDPGQRVASLPVVRNDNGRVELELDAYTDSDLFEAFDREVRTHPPSDWFSFRGAVVVVQDGRIAPLTDKHAAAWVSRHFDFLRVTREAPRKLPTPTQRVGLWLLNRSTHELCREVLPPLRGIVHRATLVELGPTYVPVAEQGYDSLSRYIGAQDEQDRKVWEIAQGFVDEASADINALLTLAEQCMERVYVELFTDFAFASDVDRVNALAMLLTPLVAEALPAVPFFIAEAPVRGTGKTTLVNACSRLWGRVYEAQYTRDEAELGKSLGAAFEDGVPLITFDNISGRLNSDVLKRLLTSPRETAIRRLGSNSTIYPPAGLVLYATANNPEIQEEVMRRSVIIRLDAKVEDPSLRTGFRHQDLAGYVTQNQYELRCYLYTILQAWRAAKMPLASCPTAFAGFQPWADLMYSLLGFSRLKGYPQLVANRAGLLVGSDVEQEEVRIFIHNWFARYPGEFVTVADLLELAEDEELLPQVQNRPSRAAKLQRMASWLGALQGRVFNLNGSQYRVAEDEQNKHHRRRYRLDSCN